ncbi:MAG: efflux RND transporter periplasmic adaptor subunit [Pirellulales bacterium]
MSRTASTSTRLRWRISPRYAALAGVAIAVVAIALTREVWLQPLRAWLATAATGEDDHGHAADPKAGDGHNHAAGDLDSIVVSEQGRKNIGLRIEPVTLAPYERTVTMPGIVVERPGRTVIRIGTPLNAIVTRIYPIAGEAVYVGQPLFDVRLTHEELVQAQVEFLSTAEELDVLQREIERLEGIGPGTIAGKTLLERKYEQQIKQALLRAKRESLLLHGLTEEHVAEILASRTLIKQVTIRVPPLAAENMPQDNPVFQVQYLAVDSGQYVQAGEALAVLTNHAELYIEGKAFEQDIADVQRARASGWPLSAAPDSTSPSDHKLGDLRILYIAGGVDPDSRTFRFFVSLPNELLSDTTPDATTRGGHRFVDWRYRPGQRMQLAVPVERWEERIVLPTDAVAEDGAETYAFVPNGKRLMRRPVHVEHRDADNVVIANDGSLFPGDLVVVAGARQLQLALKNKAGGGVDPHAGHNH